MDTRKRVLKRKIVGTGYKRQQPIITIPKVIFDIHGMAIGDRLTMIDEGDGLKLLYPDKQEAPTT